MNPIAWTLVGLLTLCLTQMRAHASDASPTSGDPPTGNPSRSAAGSADSVPVEGAESSGAARTTTKAPAGLEQLEELNLLSEALVEKAGSGSAPAHQFRIEARMYRELLRQTMLSDRERPPKQQLPQPLLLDMVRMSALLHSAADCKTGLVITCPADLMLQLKSQQSKVTQGLQMLRMTNE